jgi:hypothetical protein
MAKTFAVTTDELAYCIKLSADVRRPVQGTIPSGNLIVNDNNKPFIDAVLERRAAATS